MTPLDNEIPLPLSRYSWGPS